MPIVAVVAKVSPANSVSARLSALGNLSGRECIIVGNRKLQLNWGRRLDEFPNSLKAKQFSVLEEFLSLFSNSCFFGAYPITRLFENGNPRPLSVSRDD